MSHTHTHTHTHTERERETDKQTDRQTDRHTHTHTPGLVKFESTSPKHFLLAQQKILAIKIAVESMEMIVNMCNKDNNDVFVVVLSVQQFIFHPVINYVMFTNWPREFSSSGH